MRRTARPLKVLLVHELFPPDFAGGGEYIVMEIAAHMQAIGHDVTVVTTGDPSVTQYRGIKTRRLPISRYRLNLAWKAVAEAARHADVTHGFTYHGLYPAQRAARHLGKPFVCGVLALFGDVWLEMRGPVVGRFLRTMERALVGLPSDIRLHLSEFSRALAEEVGLYRPSDQVLEPGISQGEYYAEPDKRHVLFTGKLDVRKGIDTVMQVARALPDVPFRVIGWGERFDEFRLAKPPNVILEQRPVDRAHYLSALAGARIFLFPTKAETFGLVVPEAMASGCAVVSTSALPFEGVRVAQDDVEGARRAVRALWDDAERCARCGRENRAIARQYDWRRHAEELERVYWRVIDARAASPT